MSSFDVSEYLRSKLDFTSSGIPEITPIDMVEMVGKRPLENRMSKADNLIEASRQKEYALKMESIAKREALAKESENSWITKLGLEYDSGLGGAINLGAAFLDRTAKIASNTIAEPFSLRGQYKEQLIDPVSLDILKRQEAGEQLTPEELKVINTPIKSDLSIGPVTLPATINSQTPKEVYEGYFGLEGSKRIAREFRKATDTSSIVNKEAEGLMQQELQADPKAADALKRVSESKITDIKKEDVATLIAKAVEVGGNNPLAVSSLIASNMPNAILAGISPMALAITNIGYSQEYYDKWSDNFAKNYKARGEDAPREPTLEEKKQAQLEAFSLAAAETAGDLLTASTAKALGASLGLGKKAVGVITPEAFKASLGAFGQTTTGAIASKVVPVIANAAKATGQVVLASAGEAGTEGYQTNTENRLEKGVNASPEDIYFGMTAGALSSGGSTSISAGVGLTRDVFGAAKEAKDIYQNRQEAKTEAYNTAVETGDVAPLIGSDPIKSDWVGATEAIIENASLEGKTDEDVKAALGKVDKEIVSKLEAIIKRFSLNTEAKVDIYNKEIEKINSFLEQNPDNENAKARLAKYTAERDAPIDPDKEAQANKFIGQLQTKLNEVVSLREGLAAREIESEANVIEAAKAITAPPSTTGTTDTSKPAVDVPTFIVRAMKLRGTKSPELVTAIEEVIASGKATPEEVKTLRILADEVIASNKAKNVSKVSENVLFGSGPIKGISPTPGIDFKGVFNYQDIFEKALAIGDKETANKEFEGLKTFVNAHGKKQEAYSQLKPNQMVLFTNDGKWVFEDIPPDMTMQQAVKKATSNGGFAWFGNGANKGYTRTMANIDNEISIMVPVLQKMSLQLGKPINNEGIVSVKQTPKAQQTSQEGQKVSGTTAANTGAQQTGTGEEKATADAVAGFDSYVKRGYYSQWFKDSVAKVGVEATNVLSNLIRKARINNIKELQGSTIESNGSTVAGIAESVKESIRTNTPGIIKRVMVGNHGAYVEFTPTEETQKTLKFVKKRLQYDEYITPNGSKVYAQTKRVNYADYIPGRWYIDVQEVLNNEKVSVTPKVTSTPNNTGVPNGQGQKEKVLSTPVLAKVIATVTNLLEKVSKDKPKLTKGISKEIESEIADVAVLLKLLGISVNKGKLSELPSEFTILSGMDSLLSLQDDLDTKDLTPELRNKIAALTKWVVLDKDIDTAPREERAIKKIEERIAKLGVSKDTYLVRQVIEEMLESYVEIAKYSNNNKYEQEAKIIKAGMKVLRFGTDKQITTEGDPNIGKTNLQVFNELGTGKSEKFNKLVSEGKATFKDGIYYVKEASLTQYLAGTSKDGVTYVNLGKLRESETAFIDYIKASPQKVEMFKLMGITPEALNSVLNTTKAVTTFLRDHEISHEKNQDYKSYPKTTEGKLDLLNPAAIKIEARATLDALSDEQLAALNTTREEVLKRISAKPNTTTPVTEEGAVATTEQQEAINEVQEELSQEEAASTPEATTEGEVQGNTDDTTGNGTSSSDNSDELNAGEEVIEEEPRYTSKKEALKNIRNKIEALYKFIDCINR